MIDKEFPHLHYCGAAAGAIPAVFFVSPAPLGFCQKDDSNNRSARISAMGE
jgi:hypothetical protein